MKQEGWFDRHKTLGIILMIVGTIIVVSIIFGIFMPKDTTNNQGTVLNKNSDSVSNEISSGSISECSSNSDCSSNEQCSNGKCVEIIKADVVGHRRDEPSPVNTPQTIHFGYSWSQITDAELTLLNVKRGDSAWNAIKEANMFNDEPSESQEYLLAKFRFKVIQTSDGGSYDVSSYNFDLVSSDGVVYDKPFIVPPEPSLSKELYSGASTEGWVAFVVNKNDASPLISFNRDTDGLDELWFKLN